MARYTTPNANIEELRRKAKMAYIARFMGSGAYTWTPAELSAVAVWYDSSDLTTMFQDAAGTTAAVVGQPVGKILDKSGNGNHATQSTDLSRPILRRSGEKYYLEFDGVDDFLVTSAIDFTGTDKMSVFAGVTKNSDAATGMLTELSVASGLNNGSFQIRAPNTAAANYLFGVKGSSAEVLFTKTTYTAPITNALTLNAPLTGGVGIRINGVTVDSSATVAGGSFGSYALYIGMRAGTTLPFNGNLYSLIIRSTLSTGEEIANTEWYVNEKTGAYRG